MTHAPCWLLDHDSFASACSSLASSLASACLIPSAKPVNRMEVTSRPLIARAGMTEKILVATCISSNGKPPSTVTWDTKLKGEAEFQEIRNENGTITVISRYRLLPSREAHQQQLKCVVNYQLERFTQSTTLNVLCKLKKQE